MIHTSNKLFIIGCGGVGSWLVPKLAKVVNPRSIVLVDGDSLETKNLDRQLFDPAQVGEKKATALAAKYGTESIPEYFSLGSLETLKRRDVIFGCADNHASRRAILATCDLIGCSAIIGANEYTDAEAYFYNPVTDRGTPNDPRVVYPVILSDDSDDPLRPTSCTGEAAEATPQLVLANDWASGLMLHLYLYHCLNLEGEPHPFAKTYPAETHPVHHKVSFGKFTTIRRGERKAPAPRVLPLAA